MPPAIVRSRPVAFLTRAWIGPDELIDVDRPDGDGDADQHQHDKSTGDPEDRPEDAHEKILSRLQSE